MIAPTEDELALMPTNEQGYLRALKTYLDAPPHDWKSEACLGIMSRCRDVLDDEARARVGAWSDKMMFGEESETT
mgnify:CR=1 FL=1